MSKGSLNLRITDMVEVPAPGRIDIDLAPVNSDLGAGGEGMNLAINMGSSTDLAITGITCAVGPGTWYVITVGARHFRRYRFLQLIREGENTAGEDVNLWVNHRDVKGIRAPKFEALSPQLRRILNEAKMVQEESQDQDLAGLTGVTLYEALGPLRNACLLNIAKKASHSSSGRCLPSIGPLLVCRQNRFFAMVDDSLPAQLSDDKENYISAPDSLHKPLHGFKLMKLSFKTLDAHANLQVTFLRRTADGALAADIDLDESSGAIGHGLEVIKNAALSAKTNPYLMREFMLDADRELTLDPGYRFTF